MAGGSHNFAVLTNFDEDYEVGYLCAAVNEAYCQRWGYRFVPLCLTREDMGRVCDGRHFAWAKLALLSWLFTPRRCSPVAREVLERKLGEAGRAALLSSVDYLVWIDGDAMVVDHDVPLSQFVSGKPLVLAEDMSWADWVNTGVLLVQAGSPWVRELWADAWETEGNKHAMSASARRETSNLTVLDAASLQFANPLHAQFVLHLCGFSSKLGLCRTTISLGVLRGARLPQRPPGHRLSGPKWQAALLFLHGALQSAGPRPWGWLPRCAGALGAAASGASLGLALPRCTAEEAMARWAQGGAGEQPVLAEVAPPPHWSLAELRRRHGDRRIPMEDCSPLRADDRPRSGRFPPRGARGALWQLCDYARGLPPPCHPLLGSLDPGRLWRATRWQPWHPQEAGAEDPPDAPWECGGAGESLKALGGSGEVERELNAGLRALSAVHVLPPGARLRLQRPFDGKRAHAAIWHLEGDCEYRMFAPDMACRLGKGSDVAPLFDASQSSVDAWESTDAPQHVSVVVRQGGVLLVPAGWWIASVSLSAALVVWRPWICHRRSADLLRGEQEGAAALRAFRLQPSRAEEFAGILRRLRGPDAPPWCKEVIRGGLGSAHAREPTFSAVVHVDRFSADGSGVSSTRLAPAPSMALGERALVALRGGGAESPRGAATLLELELLAALAPAPEVLGAPPGHEPVDQVALAEGGPGAVGSAGARGSPRPFEGGGRRVLAEKEKWFVPFIKLAFRATLTRQMPRSTPPPALPPPVAWQARGLAGSEQGAVSDGSPKVSLFDLKQCAVRGRQPISEVEQAAFWPAAKPEGKGAAAPRSPPGTYPYPYAGHLLITMPI
ncbi:unnamed protein product [Prorocentrum cordatum]|uniref:JmjC domain-containing protein n=1 Tax=Prorocentrum cordatum TaxID=2364126 RepID=A0ABN9QNN3_9DINO|nr:unnamed protein product [Polarella glacialis]